MNNDDINNNLNNLNINSNDFVFEFTNNDTTNNNNIIQLIDLMMTNLKNNTDDFYKMYILDQTKPNADKYVIFVDDISPINCIVSIPNYKFFTYEDKSQDIVYVHKELYGTFKDKISVFYINI